MGKFSLVETNKRSLDLEFNKQIEENRAKIASVLRRNEIRKNEERLRKEKLVELHRQKI